MIREKKSGREREENWKVDKGGGKKGRQEER